MLWMDTVRIWREILDYTEVRNPGTWILMGDAVEGLWKQEGGGGGDRDMHEPIVTRTRDV